MRKTSLHISFFCLLFSVFCSLLSVPSSAAERLDWSGIGTTPGRIRLVSRLEKSLKAYESVRDYKAVFLKQEKSGDSLGPQETIFLKFEKPFKIFMGWMDTRKKGLQVLYERGKHDGKLAVHQPGLLLGLAPVIFLDQNSPWVKEGSESYSIEDAGIGSFLNDFSTAVVRGAKENKLKVDASGDAQGEALDVTFAGSKEQDGYFAYRVLVHFDRSTSLPDRMRLFDWQNKLLGAYAYENLRINVGDKDEEFKRLAQRQLYKFFVPSSRNTPIDK